MAESEPNGPRGWKRCFMVGPPMMALLYAQAMSGTVLTDLIVYRTCLVSLHINDTECLMLRYNSSSKEALRVEGLVEPHASTIIMTKSLVESILPALLSLFLGPWSDRYGRRPLLLAGFTGFTIEYITLSIMCNWNIDPWFLLFASISRTVLGGFCSIILASFCYISDITEEKDRALELAKFESFMALGLLFGIFTGPLVYLSFGYAAVFGAAAMCCALAGLYVLLFVPETVQNRSPGSSCYLFNVSLVQELFISCIKKREGFKRSVVWCSILILALTILVMQGEGNVEFLFTRERLGWDVQQYNYYAGASVLLSIIGMLLGVKLLGRVLRFTDTSLVALACLSSLGAAMTKAFTWKPWHMYLSVGIGMFGGVAGPVMRTILSKSAPPQDVGKVFSLSTSMEAISPLGAAPLYSMIYSHYMPPIYPAPVWLVSTGFSVVMLLLVIGIAWLIRRENQRGSDRVEAERTPLLAPFVESGV